MGIRSGLAVAVRQGALQLRDLHEDTTGPGQRREGGGDFPATYKAGENYLKPLPSVDMSQLVCILHNSREGKRHGQFHLSVAEEDTPHGSPSQRGGLLSATTAPPLTTGAQLETSLKEPLTATSKPWLLTHEVIQSLEGGLGGKSEGANTVFSMEGGLRVQGLVVQRREV